MTWWCCCYLCCLQWPLSVWNTYHIPISMRWHTIVGLIYPICKNSTYVGQKLNLHFGFSFESVSLFDNKFQLNEILFFRMTFSWEKSGQNGHHFPSLLRYKRYETVSNITTIYNRSDWEINRYFISILISKQFKCETFSSGHRPDFSYQYFICEV